MADESSSLKVSTADAGGGLRKSTDNWNRSQLGASTSEGPLLPPQEDKKSTSPRPGRGTSPRPSFRRTKRIEHAEDEGAYEEYIKLTNPKMPPALQKTLTKDMADIVRLDKAMREEAKKEREREKKEASEKPPRPPVRREVHGLKPTRTPSLLIPTDFLPSEEENFKDDPFWYLKDSLKLYKNKDKKFPSLNVLICIVGSRGDIQPFMVLAQGLIKAGHKVRIGTHEQFRDFVGNIPEIEFQDIGGDPKKMMEFIVKNPSMITLDFNEIQEQQSIMEDIFHGCWGVATAPRDGEVYHPDILICNPPILVHCQLAERLGIPLQLWFTMPWTPNDAYKHPFAWMGSSLYSNRNSYHLVDMISYNGNSAAISNWRKDVLNLPPMVKGGAGVQHSVKVPTVYCFSEGLVPRPPSWEDHISICGFLFPDNKAASEYEPPADLLEFLEAGDPPVYIGFGSIVISDPERLSNCILQALKITGKRCILSQGWMGLGGNAEDLPKTIYPIGSCPHDWLFPRCAAVVHHGGAGTTSTGLLYGRPTVIIPFFGDQPFWGEIVHSMNVGAAPIYQTDLTPQGLADAINTCFTDKVINGARAMGSKLRSENAVEKAVEYFHKYLPIDSKGRMYWRYYEHEKLEAGYGGEWRSRNSREQRGDKEGWLRRQPGDIRPGTGWSFDRSWSLNKDLPCDENGWSYCANEDGEDHEWKASPNDNRRTMIFRRRCYERWATKDEE